MNRNIPFDPLLLCQRVATIYSQNYPLTKKSKKNEKSFCNGNFLLNFVVFDVKAQFDDAALKHHNESLTSIFTKYKGQKIDFKMAITEANAYATRNGLGQIDGKALSASMQGISSVTGLLDKLLLEKKITQGYYNFVVYFDKLAKGYSASESDPTVEKVLKVIELGKQSAQYLGLNETDKSSIDFFFKAIVSSGKFWLSDLATEGTGIDTTARCRWGCFFCVIAFDAIGFIGGAWGCLVTGPGALYCGALGAGVISLVARCCICGTCSNVYCVYP